MSYSKFTSIIQLEERFGLREQAIDGLFAIEALPLFVVSERLRLDIEEGRNMPIKTEKAKSEYFISPILRELKRQNPHIGLFSGFALNIKGEKDLNGNPDFILNARPSSTEINAPIFCLVEIKNKTPDDGFAQCGAEMYAARLFNKSMGEPYETIYGAVSNGFEWIFLKLEGDTLFIDTVRYYLGDLTLLLRVLQHIVDQYK